MEDTLALWGLCAAALMLGSMYAIIVPSKVDAVLGLKPQVSKGISALGTGSFLGLLVCKLLNLAIPGIELGAVIFLLAASAPPTLALIVAVLPERVVEFLTGNRSK